MAAMRSLKGRIGQFMKRVWVEGVEQKPGQAFLVVAGTMGYAFHDQFEKVRKIRKKLLEQEAECEIMRKRVLERNADFNAKKDDLLMQMAVDFFWIKKK
ncbi:uncharacterized protein LOC108859634 isoform X2 [Raphanus sativus]|uniref:Uncharacterized protein LOC108859634 isoform X2 n=1 Tax=Raphanus sativus TaxID=3726 RepID=A0A6J0NZD9_RAPSA|nr:uncharacterized protein LOC108859634 isoform X2 [Raphanus sativus]